MVNTTISISNKIINLIIQHSHQLGITPSALIVEALSSQLSYLESRNESLGTINYQKFITTSSWSRFHIYLSTQEYEHLLDLRRFLKISVSKIISIALKNYLSLCIKKVAKKEYTDNYRFNSHSMIVFYSPSGKQTFISCWGIPDEIHIE
jgi:hypothetical protein